jgi:hypothetical protein
MKVGKRMKVSKRTKTHICAEGMGSSLVHVERGKVHNKS